MEILVCMKQVPDDSAEIRMSGDGRPDLAGVDPQGNAFDTYAQELAVRFVEEHGGAVNGIMHCRPHQCASGAGAAALESHLCFLGYS